MKSKSIFAGLACLALTVLAGCGSSTPKVERLHVEGCHLVNESGQVIAYHGISFGWHNLWPRFYNEAAVKNLTEEWGCRFFRAAIGADDHSLGDNPGKDHGYMADPELALKCLYAVIDGAIASGSYIIVDWHSHVQHPEEAAEFFRTVATKYKGVPNVIYELYNEPTRDSWKSLKEYAEGLIKVISDADPSNPVILMGCPTWDQAIDQPAADPIKGYDNLMYTVHFYAGTHKQWLRDKCDKAMEAGIPILISECACCDASGDGAMDMDSWKEWSDWADSKGVTMLTWSVGDKNETCSFFTPDASSEGPWADEFIKPWGKVVREWIKNNN